MATTVPFRLPDLGEGLTDGQILRWLVVPGDVVTLNQNIVEIETAKAAVELPSPHAGRVVELLHAQGATVDVGAPIITFELTDTVPAADNGHGGGGVTIGGVVDQPETGGAGGAGNGRTAVLVGYGPLAEVPGRRRRRSSTAPDSVVSAAPVSAAPVPATPVPAISGAAATPARVLAKPPVRKLARELGVDLAGVRATGPDHTVTRDDVTRASVGHRDAPAVGPAQQRVAVTGVRKLTAEAMVASVFTAPHVTVFLTVDATASMQLLSALKQLPEFAGVRLSPLLVVAKAVLFALRRHPELNSHWDQATGEIVVKRDVNLGIAAATPRGLLVPVIAGADAMSMLQLAAALGEVATLARSGRVSPAQLAGGTFSISNIGVFGVDAGTPILPPGQGAILAVGTIAPRPWVHEGAVVPRQVTTLSVSFDHRIIDGEQGSKFLADIGRFLRDPALAMVE